MKLSYMTYPGLKIPEVITQLSPSNSLITKYAIFNIVCKYFGRDTSEVLSKTRKIEILQVRQIYHYFAIKYTKESLEIIAATTNNDHATVINSRRRISNLIDTERLFKQKMI